MMKFERYVYAGGMAIIYSEVGGAHLCEIRRFSRGLCMHNTEISSQTLLELLEYVLEFGFPDEAQLMIEELL